MIQRYVIKKGTTSKRLAVFIQDATRSDGVGLAALVFNSSGLVCYGWREDEGNAAATAVTLVTATRGTYANSGGAGTGGGFIQKDSTNFIGWYELSVPNAFLATAADWAKIMLSGAADMAPAILEIELVDNIEKDTYDIVNHVTYGNAQLVRSTTPANTFDVSATGEGGLDFNNVKDAGSSHTLTNITVPTVTTLTNAPSDSSGVTTLLSRLTSGRATNLDNVDAAVTSRLAPTTAGRTLDVSATGEAGLDFDNIKDATGAHTLTNITVPIVSAVSGAVGSVTGNVGGSVGSVTGAVGSVTGNVGGNVTGSVGSVTGNVGGNVTGSIGSLAAQAKLDVNAEVDSALDTAIPSSPTANSINERIKTLDDNYTSPPTAAANADAVWDELRADHVTTGTFGQGVASVQGNVTGSVASVTADVGITQTGADKVWTSAARTLTSFGTLVADIWSNATRTLSAFAFSVTVGTNNDKTGYSLSSSEEDTIADKVWDEVRSGHTTSGTFGQGAASVQGNVTGSVASVTADVGITQSGADKVWTSAARTLSSFGTLIADIWGNATRTLTAFSFSVTVGTNSDKTGYSLTSGERDDIADAHLDRVDGVETGRTPRQILRLLAAGDGGKASGAATTSFKLRDTNDTKDRVTATVDADGNRTAVTLDLS